MAEVIAETGRLRLTTWSRETKAEFVRRLNTPAVMRWLGGVQDQAAYDAGFERIDSYQRDHGHTLWAIERKEDGALLGFCGLKRVNSTGASNPGDFEIGWRLREDAWGHGYAKEAAIASLDLAFGRFAAPHVVALTVAGNQASQGLMKRLGMTRCPDLDFECTDPWAAEPEPVIVYRIDADEWPAARAAALSS